MVPSPSWKEGKPADPPQGAPTTEETSEAIAGRYEDEQELLHRHLLVLQAVKENEPVGIIKLAELTGFAQHKVRYSLRVLEQEGLIEPSSMGARTTDRLPAFLATVTELVDGMHRTLAELRKG